MTGDDAPLEVKPLRALDELRKVMTAGVEMLIKMDVKAPTGMLGDLKEKIQEGRRIIRQRRGAPHAIGPGRECRLHQGARGSQVPRCRAGKHR